MVALSPGDIVHGRIDRVSNRGNGILAYRDGEISVGPVRDDAVGTDVDAVVYNEELALCLTSEARAEFYENRTRAMTGQLIEDPPAGCPGVGETIAVELQSVNSAGHGNATHEGLPIRIQNAAAGNPGETIPVKIIRIEPTRLVATGITSLRLRDRPPEVGEVFTAPVAYRTQSGNGIVESFIGHRFNIGPVRPEAVEETIEAVLLDDEFAYCLTTEFLAPAYHEAMRERVTEPARARSKRLRERLDPSETEPSLPGRIVRPVRKRDSGFSRQVRDAYDHTCAVCGQRWQDEDGYFEVEAAHIYPVSGADPDDSTEGGPDALQNGMALCRTHHWAFDHGWFSIDDDYSIVVRDDPSLNGYEEMKQYDGDQLHLPSDRSAWPAKHYVAYHRDRLWQG